MSYGRVEFGLQVFECVSGSVESRIQCKTVKVDVGSDY